MKNYKTNWVLFVLGITFCAGSQMVAYAAPIFPPSDNQPINQVAEIKNIPAEESQKTTSTATANLHKDMSFGLAQVDIIILYGINQDGKKSYKTTYQLAEVTGDESIDPKDPRIRITYKKKTDKDKYAVEEVAVKKMANNAYKITVKIIDVEPGETITPKVTWVN